jgi:hypothetical protein
MRQRRAYLDAETAQEAESAGVKRRRAQVLVLDMPESRAPRAARAAPPHAAAAR